MTRIFHSLHKQLIKRILWLLLWFGISICPFVISMTCGWYSTMGITESPSESCPFVLVFTFLAAFAPAFVVGEVWIIFGYILYFLGFPLLYWRQVMRSVRFLLSQKETLQLSHQFMAWLFVGITAVSWLFIAFLWATLATYLQ